MAAKRVKKRASSAAERELQRLLRRSLRQGSRAIYQDAAFFDRLYGRRKQDIGFYVEVAQRYGGPVLELGVGTGRVAAALAQAGVDVVGVDVMSGMLERAQAALDRLGVKTRRRVSLRRGDMRRLSLGRRFPLVIAPFNVFNHLYSRRDLERTLLICMQHLRPRGRLVFDVVMPELRALLQSPDRFYDCGSVVDPSDGQRYRHHEASHYDPQAQVRTVTMLFEPEQGASPPRAIPLSQRQFFPAELEALLRYNGFELEARYGDFDCGPLTLHSESQIVVAKGSFSESGTRRSRPAGGAGR